VTMLSSRPLTAAEYAEAIQQDLSAGVTGVVRAGNRLDEAKRSLPHGTFTAMVTKQLRLDPSTPQRLMAIARHEVLANAAHCAAFPSSWTTLYELSKLPASVLLQQIHSGAVTRDMGRAEAKALVQTHRREEQPFDPSRGDDDDASLPPAATTARIVCGDAAAAATWAGIDCNLVVTSPPYNVGQDYEGAEDALPLDEWCQLLGDMASLAVAAGAGRLAINVPAITGRRPEPVRTADAVVFAVAGLGLRLEAEIVWDKATTGNRTSWGSWCSPADPVLRDRTERILVFRSRNEISIPAGALVRDPRGRLVSPWLSAERFTTLTQDLWTFGPARRDGGHPCPFPVELPLRLLQLFGWPGCTVVDPFAGSGTTGVAAAELGANAVLIDCSPAYCNAMRRRLAKEA
jgi:modification methylase